MSDWVCRFCGTIVRGRINVPHYCVKCGPGKFEHLVSGHEQSSPRNGSAAPAAVTSAPLPTVYMSRAESRTAKRIKPSEALLVHLSWVGPLRVVNISATGVLLEHTEPFRPGSIYDVELRRCGQAIRLRGRVVRCVATAPSGGSRAALRYCSGVHFLEAPPDLLSFLPELSELF